MHRAIWRKHLEVWVRHCEVWGRHLKVLVLTSKYMSGISQYGRGILKYGSGISMYGSGISKYGSGISKYGLSPRCVGVFTPKWRPCEQNENLAIGLPYFMKLKSHGFSWVLATNFRYSCIVVSKWSFVSDNFTSDFFAFWQAFC